MTECGRQSRVAAPQLSGEVGRAPGEPYVVSAEKIPIQRQYNTVQTKAAIRKPLGVT